MLRVRSCNTTSCGIPAAGVREPGLESCGSGILHEGAGGEKGSALWLIGLCAPALDLTSPVLPWSAVNARHQPPHSRRAGHGDILLEPVEPFSQPAYNLPHAHLRLHPLH